MKNATLRLFLILLLFVAIISLQACKIVDKNSGGDNTQNQQEDTAYFDWSNLNYSWNKQNGESIEYGYTIFDAINLSGVQLSKAVDANSVYFEIYFDGVKKTTVSRNPSNQFSPYRLDKKGNYQVKIFGKTTQGVDIYQQFDFSVASLGRADSVEVVIKNSSGVVVDYVEGGGTYTFLAKIYSDGKQIDIASKDFFWKTPSNAGKKEYKYTVGNQTTTQTIDFDFHCFVYNNLGEKVDIFSQTFEQRDNLLKTEEFPEGIYFDYGMDIANSSASLYLNLAQTEHKKYFYNNITAEYRFKNGDTQVLPLSTNKADNTVYLLISYDNTPYKVYDISDYDYSKDRLGKRIPNYFDNGVKYQFDPQANSAKIQLCRKIKTYDATGSISSEKVVENSAIDIAIVKQNTDSILATKISGSHKNDTVAFATNYKTFSKNITNNITDLYVFCDMKGNGVNANDYLGNALSDSKQYFVIEIADIVGSLWDYTIDFAYQTTQPPIRLVTYENTALGIFDQYFVCPNYGNATVNVRSRFGGIIHTFEINVVDKVFHNSTKIDKESLQDYGLFCRVKVDNFIKLKEYRLSSFNDKSFIKRSLQEDEYLEYYIGNNKISPSGLDYTNNGYVGQDIKVYLKGDFITVNIYETISASYIIPNFALP